jgi:hypothetical protein
MSDELQPAAIVLPPATFAASAHPEDVLAALAADHPGARVVHHAGATPGWTILWLVIDGHPLLSVREPGHGWPVTVIHFHGDAQARTDYTHCGPHHNPNRHRLSRADLKEALAAAKPEDDERIRKEHREEVERQKGDSLIDSPQKLYDLCKSLLDGATPHSAGHTEAVKARAARFGRRYQPRRAELPGEAPLVSALPGVAPVKMLPG